MTPKDTISVTPPEIHTSSPLSVFIENLYSPKDYEVHVAVDHLRWCIRNKPNLWTQTDILRIFAAISQRWNDPVMDTLMGKLAEDNNEKSRTFGGTELFEQPLNWLTCCQTVVHPTERCSCLNRLTETIRNMRDTGKILSPSDQSTIGAYLSTISAEESSLVCDAAERALNQLTLYFFPVPYSPPPAIQKET
jgi:hypothetical protein